MGGYSDSQGHPDDWYFEYGGNQAELERLNNPEHQLAQVRRRLDNRLLTLSDEERGYYQVRKDLLEKIVANKQRGSSG